MNGRTHAAIGCSLVPLSALAGDLSLPDAALLTAVAAGFSLGPDIDHPNATVTRATPNFVHEVFHGMSQVVLKLFSTRKDKFHTFKAEQRGIDPAHRSLTHTLIFASFAAGFGYLCAQSRLSLAALVLLSTMLCRALLDWGKPVKSDGECTDGGMRRNPWGRSFMTGVAFGLAGLALVSDLPADHVGLAAGAGWLSHIIADGCTKAGVPMLWPVKIKGRRWWRVRILGSWLPSGDRKEWLAALGVAAVMNVPQLMLIT